MKDCLVLLCTKILFSYTIATVTHFISRYISMIFLSRAIENNNKILCDKTKEEPESPVISLLFLIMSGYKKHAKNSIFICFGTYLHS